jgi:hypothetical protein
MEEKLKLLKDLKIPHAALIQNNECAICHSVEKEMVNIGSAFMCKKCFFSEFQTDDPMNKEREKYLGLINRKDEVQL